MKKRITPSFVINRYATLDGGQFYKEPFEGKKIIKGELPGLERIGIKPDTSSWMRQDFYEWKIENGLQLTAREQADWEEINQPIGTDTGKLNKF